MCDRINKKILTKFIFVFFLFLGINSANAATCGLATGVFCNVISTDTIAGAIVLIIRYLLSIVGILSFLFLVIGGIRYILSAGNEEKMKSAKDATYSAGLGLAIALMAFTILEIIFGILNRP
ncbi:hypothetical protein K0B03_03265 [Patescibacteria group bacterium]|nr:hypothetical protein [Patescibacteria group bacterium]